MIYVGIDWAKDSHAVAILDSEGRPLKACAVNHSGAALAALQATLAALEPDPTAIAVAMEAHDGALLAWLLAAGYTVYAINPKSAKRYRERHCPSGAKSDRTDAVLLARMLRADGDTLRPVRPDSPQTQELRAWVELRAALVGERTQACQQLQEYLGQWCPELGALCDSPQGLLWQRDLLAKWPLHTDLSAAHGNAVRAFTKAHRLGAKAREALTAARAALPLPLPAALQECMRARISYLVTRLSDLAERIGQLERRLAQLVAAHPDVQLFASLPITGTVTTATLMAAFGDDRQAPHGWQQRACLWGVAPITIQSGRSTSVRFRRGCDETARHGLLYFALGTLRAPGCWARELYDAKRAAGKGHFGALRCVAQRWVKIIHAMWRDRTTYDEATFRAARKPVPAV